MEHKEMIGCCRLLWDQ